MSPDGSALLAVDDDQAIRLIDLKTGSGTDSSVSRLPLKMASFMSDGKQILTQSENVVTRRWDVVSGKELGRTLPRPHYPT